MPEFGSLQGCATVVSPLRLGFIFLPQEGPGLAGPRELGLLQERAPAQACGNKIQHLLEVPKSWEFLVFTRN